MDRDRVNCVKGILMLAVIVGHNEALTHSNPWLRQILYYFHVQCFFLLSSLLDTKPFSVKLLADRAVRYLVPFVTFMGLAWIAFRTLRHGTPDIASSLSALFSALVFGGEGAIHQAVGLRYLWFLPSLFSLVVFKSLASRGGFVAQALLGIAILWLGVAALVPLIVRSAMPLGSAEGLFFFGLGELFRRVCAWARLQIESASVGIPAAAVALTIAVMICIVPLGWVAAANIGTYDIREPATWIAALLFPCLMLPALLWVSNAVPLPGVAAFGRYSLPIYLVHMFVYRFLTRAWFGSRYDELATVGENVFAGIVILGMTVGLSLAISIAIWRFCRLRALLFPRDWQEWRAAFLGAAA